MRRVMRRGEAEDGAKEEGRCLGGVAATGLFSTPHIHRHGLTREDAAKGAKIWAHMVHHMLWRKDLFFPR